MAVTPAQAQLIIDANIFENSREYITGSVMHSVLTVMNAALASAYDGAFAINVGGTLVNGGTSTHVLFDNAGVVGEYAISGDGNVAMSHNPTFTGVITCEEISGTNPTFLEMNIVHPTRPFIYMSAVSLGSDKGAWNYYIEDGDTAGTLRMSAMNDSGLAQNDWLRVFRTGYVPQYAQFLTPVRVATEMDVFGMFTDNANYEGLNIEWNGTFYQIATVKAGTGSSRDIEIARDSGAALYLSGTNFTFGVGSNTFTLTPGAAHLAAFQGGLAATTLALSSNITLASGTILNWNSDGTLSWNSSGLLQIGTGATANGSGSLLLTNLTAAGKIGAGGATSSSTFVNLAAGTTGVSQIRFVQGVAPSAPVDGDMWREDNTNTGLKIRINGVTKTVTVG